MGVKELNVYYSLHQPKHTLPKVTFWTNLHKTFFIIIFIYKYIKKPLIKRGSFYLNLRLLYHIVRIIRN
jgi:hypothetical protein